MGRQMNGARHESCRVLHQWSSSLEIAHTEVEKESLESKRTLKDLPQIIIVCRGSTLLVNVKGFGKSSN